MEKYELRAARNNKIIYSIIGAISMCVSLLQLHYMYYYKVNMINFGLMIIWGAIMLLCLKYKSEADYQYRIAKKETDKDE